MKLKILAAFVAVGLLFTACKQTPKVDSDQNKNQIAKKQRNANKSNQNAKKANSTNKKTLEANKRKIRQELDAKKKVASKKISPKTNNTNPVKKGSTTKSKVSVGSNSKLNTPQYYAELKKTLKLDDNKLRGIEGINKAFDQKISTMPKIKGKLNLTEIKKINELRANSLKRFLTEPVYKKKLAFDAKYSRRK